MAIRAFSNSFNGGEISPEMFGRWGDDKYQAGLRTCRNFIVQPTGPIKNRPGFAFVREVKDSSKKVRVIPFVFSTTETRVIEIGEGYFRFHANGGTVLDGTNNVYELANTFTESELFDIHYIQSADVMTLVHPGHPRQELRRLGAANWTLITINSGSPLMPPTNLTATFTSQKSNTDYDYKYVVTALADDFGTLESLPSSPVSVSGNLFDPGGQIALGWNSANGAARYNVFKLHAGLFGYIGQTEGTTMVDDNIAADLSTTPPNYDSVFDSEDNYPGAVAYFEQRRWFGGTETEPQNVWATRSGTESNMGYSIPVRADDRIAFRIAARQMNTIRHIVPMTELLLLTSSGEWRVTSTDRGPLTPATIAVAPQSFVGASNVQPALVNTTLVYGAARGGHLRELAYDWNASGYISGDLCLRASHLFDQLQVADMVYAKSPIPIVWCVSSNGSLLGLTYIPGQKVAAWHQHDTTHGVFESCTAVAESNEDRLYCVVKRTINGQTRRYIERMSAQAFDNLESAFFVDSGLTYDGASATTFSGLDHLEGEEVSILADGAVMPRQAVTNGSITITHPASKVHVGLPITADARTLPVPVNLQDGSFGTGHVKNVNKIWLRVLQSSGIFAGPDENSLVGYKQRTTESPGSPPALKSGPISIMIKPRWGDDGSVLVRQEAPLPLMLLSLAGEIELGN